jgi:hypothetical protein
MIDYTKADATHINFPVTKRNEQFEWWYFDAHFDNGDHFVAMYSLNDTRLKPRQPSVRLNIYPKGQPNIWKMNRYTEAEVSTSYEKCDTKFGEEYCKDCGDYYELCTMIDGYGARLKLSKQNHPFTSEGTDFPLPWTVAVPSGPIEGELYKGGEAIKVKGVGYHDHNWGEKSLAGALKNWYWGKIHTPDISIDYGIFMDFDDHIALPGALVTDKNNIIMSPVDSPEGSNPTVFKAVINDTMTEETMGYTFAKDFTLKGTKKDISFIANIKLEEIIMIEKATLSPGEDVYRYIAKEELIVTRNGDTKTYTTDGLHEIVYLLK